MFPYFKEGRRRLIIERFNNDWKFWQDTDSFALVWDVPEQAQCSTP